MVESVTDCGHHLSPSLQAMNMVKPLDLITPIHPAPYQFPDPVATAGLGSGNSQQVPECFKPLNPVATFEPLPTGEADGRADIIGGWGTGGWGPGGSGSLVGYLTNTCFAKLQTNCHHYQLLFV